MSVKNWLVASALLPGLCLVAHPALARQQQQESTAQKPAGDPIVEAARKAREHQKDTPKPKKIYTDDDIKPRTDTSAAATNQSGGSSQAAPKNAQDAAAKGTVAGGTADEEAAWRKRFADQREKIAIAEKELDILRREDDKAQVQYYSDPQKALMEQNSRKDINDKQAKIDQKEKQIADLKQQLTDMEDQLRKSGGDPGWARQ